LTTRVFWNTDWERPVAIGAVPSTALRGTNWRCSKPTLSMPIV